MINRSVKKIQTHDILCFFSTGEHIQMSKNMILVFWFVSSEIVIKNVLTILLDFFYTTILVYNCVRCSFVAVMVPTLPHKAQKTLQNRETFHSLKHSVSKPLLKSDLPFLEGWECYNGPMCPHSP